MRKLFIAVNVLIAMLMIGAVTLVGRNSASAAPSYAGSVSFGTWSSNPTEQAGQKKLVQAFENKYHINVNFQVLNGDYSTVLKARLTAGTAPDVFYLNSTDAQSFIRTGALANLDFLAKDKSFGFSEFYNSLQFGFKWKGHTYAMAKDYSPLALWYNKTLFAKAGISKPPTTWAQITADACKLTDKANHIYGVVTDADPARWLAFVYGAGGALLNKQETKAVIDSSASMQALQFYAGLQRKGCSSEHTDVGASWSGDAFGKGLAAMVFEGNWLSSAMQQTYPDIKYGVAPLPKGPKGFGNIAFTAAYAMNSKSAKKSTAITLMKYLAGKSGETTWSHVVGYLPSRKDIKAPAGIHASAFVSEAKYSRDYFWPAGFSDRALTPIGNDLDAVMKGKMSYSAALQDMQSKAQAALSNAP